MFESVPMVPAIVVFCVWHPAAYFGGRERGAGKSASDDVPLEGVV